jgi:hypothetical protein
LVNRLGEVCMLLILVCIAPRLEDMKEDLHGCVLQVINLIHHIQLFIQYCCRVIIHDIICSFQACMELQPLLASVTPLFEKWRVDYDHL